MTSRKKTPILPGDKFSRLTVLSQAPYRGNSRYFNCICDCGNRTTSRAHDLRTGAAKSCGCLRRETFVGRNTKHGHSRTLLYHVWVSMRQRCSNTGHHCFNHYGERGIVVCHDWEKFGTFRRWALRNGYRKGLTLERKNNDGNYCPENCAWIEQSEQSKNTRRCIRVVIDGETFPTLKDAARKFGQNPSTVYVRRWKGMSIEAALGVEE